MRVGSACLASLLVVASTGYALASPNCTLPYTLTNGQTADASQVMANLNAIINCMGSPSIGFVNKFRNGTFDVWQRGTTSSALSSSGQYTADGWKVYYSGTAPGFAQSSGPTDGAPTLYGLTLLGATGNTDVKLGQRIESSVAAPLAGQRVTFQIQVFNPGSVTLTPQISTCYASATDNFSTCVSDLAPTNLQTCAPVGLCTLAYVFNVSANASKGYEVDIDFGAITPSNFTDLRIYAADIRGTPGVPTGLNGSPPPPELRPIAVELLFCQRYLYSIFPNLSVGVVSEGGLAYNSSGVLGTVRFPAVMRAVPTLTISAASDFGPIIGGSAGPAFTGISLGGASTTDRVFLIASGSSGLTGGNASFIVSIDTSARLTFSSEL